MASHHKIFVNESGLNEFCFMPTLNTSTFGYITNQTLKYPQTVHPLTTSQIVTNLLIIFFGLTVNGLIGYVLIKDKKLRSESISPSIISLIGANFSYGTSGLGWILSAEKPFSCRLFGTFGYALMLCSVFNLQCIGILRFIKLYFLKDMNERRFRKVCIFVSVFAWILSFIVSFPTAIGQFGQVAIECNTRKCKLTNVNSDGSNTGFYVSTLYYASLIIVGISNILLNIAIYYKIQSYFKAIVSEINNFSTDMAMDYMKKENQTAKMMGADSVLYVVFPIPRAVLCIVDPHTISEVYKQVGVASMSLWGATAIVEPLLLLFFKEKYRKEIRKILKGSYSSVKNKFITKRLPANISVTD